MLRLRNNSGAGQIAELGPSLFIIIICVVLPLMEFLYLGSAYCFGWYLDHLLVREASTHSPYDANDPNAPQLRVCLDAILNQWKEGIGVFSGGNASYAYPPTYFNRSGGTNPDTVSVATDVEVRPFLPVPFFNEVPGLGKPVTFHYEECAQQEESGKD
jgi:hypothetical protein